VKYTLHTLSGNIGAYYRIFERIVCTICSLRNYFIRRPWYSRKGL